MTLKGKILVVSILAAAIQAVAAESKTTANNFVGAEVGYATFSHESPNMNLGSKSALAGGIRFGTELENGRIYGTFTYGSFKNKAPKGIERLNISEALYDEFSFEVNAIQLNVNADYQYEVANVKGLKLFGGPHIGIGRSTGTLKFVKAKVEESDTTFQLGLQAGARYRFNKNLSGEAGYRVSWFRSFENKGTISDKRFSRINQPYLSVNYHF